jgi:hypothetical protein
VLERVVVLLIALFLLLSSEVEDALMERGKLKGKGN